MKRLLLILICLAAFGLTVRAQDITTLEKIGPVTSFSRDDHSVTFTCRDNSQVQLTVLAPDLIRVRASFTKAIPARDHSWAIAKADWVNPDWKVAQAPDSFVITTSELQVVVRRSPLLIEFRDAKTGKTINADALRLFNREIFNTFDLRDRLRNITAPTLVITGEDDFICGPVCAAEISAAVPNAREVIVGDAGHMTFIEQPQAFHDEVAGFLES